MIMNSYNDVTVFNGLDFLCNVSRNTYNCYIIINTLINFKKLILTVYQHLNFYIYVEVAHLSTHIRNIRLCLRYLLIQINFKHLKSQTQKLLIIIWELLAQNF